MNIIDLISKTRKNLSNLQDVLDTVRNSLSDHKEETGLQGKTLRRANTEQSALFGYYDEIRVHLQSLADYLDIRIAERRAKVIKIISEESRLDYGERTREKLVDEDPDYIDLKLKKLEVDEVLELAKSICKQMEIRGYSLTNISKCVAAKTEDEYIILGNNE